MMILMGSTAARPLLVLLSLCFAATGLAQKPVTPAAGNATSPTLRGTAPSGNTKEFIGPTVKGYRLAYCTDDAEKACGQRAADAFCASANVSCVRALAYGGLPLFPAPTYQIGDGKVKAPGTNDAFDRIVCQCGGGAARRSLLATDYGNPSFRGYRIAYCLDDQKSGCGQASADKFCQAQQPSCSRASAFSMVSSSSYQGPTFQQGDGKVKGPGSNDAFDKITCECDIVRARFDSPKVNGLPLDYCLKKAGEDGGTLCGDPPATAFCQSQGYARSVRFEIDPDAGKHNPDTPTWFIGDGATHTAPGRAAFSVIDCGN